MEYNESRIYNDSTTQTTPSNMSEVIATWNESATFLNWYFYNGDFGTFNPFDLLPESYRNARSFLYNYLVVIIWIVSILGNMLVILVLMRKRNRNFSTSIYLKGLAFADLTLNTSNTFMLYVLAHGYIKLPASDIECRYRNVLSFAIVFISTWMLVVISLERVISVWMPFKVKRMCTANVAYVVITVMWVFFLGLALLHERLYTLDVPVLGCQIRQEYVRVYSTYISWFLISFKFLIPFVIIFTCSLIIMVILCSRKIKKNSTAGTDKGMSVYAALLSVNIVFLLTMSPYALYHLFADYDMFDSNRPLLSYFYYHFWLTYLQVLNDCNSAVNVFLYFLIGSRFRTDVKELLFECIRKKKASMATRHLNNLSTRDTTLSSTKSSIKHEDMKPSTAKVFVRQESQFTM